MIIIKGDLQNCGGDDDNDDVDCDDDGNESLNYQNYMYHLPSFLIIST